jgi:hypothetical protein
VKFVTRSDIDLLSLGLYEVRENQHTKGSTFHLGINEITHAFKVELHDILKVQYGLAKSLHTFMQYAV